MPTTKSDTSTRRTFINSAGLLAAVALAAPLRAGESNDDCQSVRVLVIGTGGRGSDLIRALTTIEAVQIVGVCDDYPPHLAQGAKYAGPQAAEFSDYRIALDKLKPQAVVVAVPLSLHFQVCSDALNAGCDVFCEKTMCATVEQARQLTALVATTKRVFQVGLQRRANAIYIQAQAMVDAGMIGEITAIKAQWHRHNSWRRPLPVARDHRDWPALERRLNWRLYRESSAGLMAELGSHQLDVATWFLGTGPKRVMASGGIDHWRDGRDVYDNIFCMYEYEVQPHGAPEVKSPAVGSPAKNDAVKIETATIDTANNTGVAKPRIVRVTYSSLCNNAYEGAAELIMGTRGSLYLTAAKGMLYREAAADRIGWAASGQRQDRAEKNASVVAAGKTLKLSSDPWAHRGTPIEIDNAGGDDTRDELTSFIDHVRRGDPATICDARTGLINAATVLLANESADKGTAIDFPADLI